MRKSLPLGLLALSLLQAEVHTMSLREAVRLALRQNPSLVLARLEEVKAVQSAREAADPFSPKLILGSGLAYSSGFPLSIEGSAPAVVRAEVLKTVFDRPRSYLVRQAQESARAAQYGAEAQRHEIAFRTAGLCLDILRLAKTSELSRGQVPRLEQVGRVVEARIEEGRALPLERKKVTLEIAQARHRAQVQEGELAYAQGALAGLLGLASCDRVEIRSEEEPLPAALPASAEEALRQALDASQEVRQLESQIAAAGFEEQAHRSARWPRVDLVAQYALLGRYNNYEDFFKAFQRHNGQLGVSVQLPLLPGSGAQAAAARAGAEATRLRTRLAATRSEISLAVERAWQQFRAAESSREVARLGLDVAREELSVLLAQFGEGRAGLRQVEEARSREAHLWVTFYEAHFAVEQSRFALLRHTGGLLAAVQ